MEAQTKANFGRAIIVVLAALSLLISLLALYVKLYFWGGTRFAPSHVKALIWLFIAAGPLASLICYRMPWTALAIIGLQFGLLIIASI